MAVKINGIMWLSCNAFVKFSSEVASAALASCTRGSFSAPGTAGSASRPRRSVRVTGSGSGAPGVLGAADAKVEGGGVTDSEMTPPCWPHPDSQNAATIVAALRVETLGRGKADPG